MKTYSGTPIEVWAEWIIKRVSLHAGGCIELSELSKDIGEVIRQLSHEQKLIIGVISKKGNTAE